VSYDVQDRFKRMAQEVAARSCSNIGRFGLSFVEWTRGESIQLYEHRDFYLGHVDEGLGTLNLVHDKMFFHKWHSYDRSAAYNTVASIVNDGAMLGAMPINVHAHIAAGGEHWFVHEERIHEFLEGWLEACTDARCGYDGGETAILRDLVKGSSAVLSGSSTFIISPKSRLIRRNIEAGDLILLLSSSGIHANGATLARDIAEKLPNGYQTKMSDGRMFGEALCEKSHIYPPFIEDCLNAGAEIHYGVHITGHGWRKLMRAPEPFAYIINDVPTPQPVFDFIAQKGKVPSRNMYGDYNMGAGFALYVPWYEEHRIRSVWAAGNYPFALMEAGYIEKSAKRRVVINPIQETFEEKELQVR